MACSAGETDGRNRRQPLLNSQRWEEIKRGGDAAIQKWIDEQMSGKSCVVVLIGSQTAGRKWVKYEIEKGWNAGKGVVGVYIHNLEDASGNTDTKGRNSRTISSAQSIGRGGSSISHRVSTAATASRSPPPSSSAKG
jgi:Thoeris protein ThsB, TIR-like domain